jgi:superfamily I DNA/RNA helicase
MTGAAVAPSARDRVLAFLDDPKKISVAQRAAVEHPGNFFLSACPGSGKTRTVGVRTAWAAVDGEGRIIAATSYTNTAVRQIQEAAAAAGAPIAEPHFVGTLHSFLLRYVFYPFGHLVMGCEPPARLVFGDFHRVNDPQTFAQFEDGKPKPPPIPVWDFHFRPNGGVVINKGDIPYGLPLDPQEVVKRCGEYVVEQKRELAKRGIASPSDAMFYALDVLQQHQVVREALATRFDEIIVDEVQDTSAVQLECIRQLHATGKLASVVLTGDLEQAIYEWAGAHPEDVEALVSDLGLEEVFLNENFRSSQAICDVAYRFSRREAADVAIGENCDLGHAPELLLYDKDDPRQAIAAFEQRLDELGIEKHNARVLCRGGALQERLLEAAGIDVKSRVLKVLGRAAVAVREAGVDAVARRDVEELERLLRSFVWKEPPASLDWEDRLAFRDALMRLFEFLPDVELQLKEWIPDARAAVKDALAVFGSLEVQPGDKMKVTQAISSVRAADAFGRQSGTPLEALTVHSVKGETHEGVLLVGARTTKYDHGAQWLESPQSAQEPEEVRVAYVALTRAAKYCLVALPSGTSQGTIDEFMSRGFVLRDAAP